MPRLLAHVRKQAVAYLALFVALGGTGYAALAIPANSVGSRQLRRGAVTENKLGKRSVGSANLNPKSITGSVAAWAQISPTGQLLASSPGVSVKPFVAGGGDYVVTWKRHVSPHCFLLAGVTNTPNPGYATTLFQGGFTGAYVQTFNGGGVSAPEFVNVAVICP